MQTTPSPSPLNRKKTDTKTQIAQAVSRSTQKQAEQLKAARLILFTDFEVYCRTCVKIRNKEGKEVPFLLNPAQKRLLRTCLGQLQLDEFGTPRGKIRLIILKARQMGFSTFISAFLYWFVSQRAGQKAITVAHIAESTRSIHDMLKRIHAAMPSTPFKMAPQTSYSNRKELSFSEINSAFMVATAGGDGIARGETLNCAHLSEVAFYPSASAADNVNGLLQAIPQAAGTMVFFESTANGIAGSFAELWERASKDQSEFEPFFAAWFEDPSYRVPVYPDFKPTDDERKLAQLHNLDDEQIMFRRIKIGESGREKFCQEYPSTADEAFLTSGRPVFDPLVLAKIEPRQPIRLLGLNGMADKWIPNDRGELREYLPLDPLEQYYIGCDVAGGGYDPDGKHDYSVAQVLDSQKRQAAVWVGKPIPDFFATVLYQLGKRFNYARIAVEANNHGLATNTKLIKDLKYPNSYFQESDGELSERYTDRLGYLITSKTKPLIIDNLHAELRNGTMQVYSRDTIKELKSYIYTDSNKMKAEDGSHDDHVMALALANHIHMGVFKPIEITDEFYTEVY